MSKARTSAARLMHRSSSTPNFMKIDLHGMHVEQALEAIDELISTIKSISLLFSHPFLKVPLVTKLKKKRGGR